MKIVTQRERKRLIVQSNEVTEAAYYLTIKAKRVLWLCLAQAYNSDTAAQGVFSIHVSDYQSLFGVSDSAASRDIKAAMTELLKSFVTFYPKDGDDEEISYPWMAKQSIKRGRGEFVIEFNKNLLPYITGLSEKFTQFYLHHCGKLNNARTIRLYESLCQWAQAGIWKVDVEWLIKRYELPASQANNFAEMRRKFIEPAVNRINKNTPLKVDFKELYDGSHKVTSLIFNIETIDE